MSVPSFKGIVFSGGGTRCLIFCELLVLLERAGRLEKVEQIWGTSAGALFGTLYLLTRSADRVKSLLMDLDFSTLRNVDVTNLLNIMNVWAIDDGSALLGGIERLLDAAVSGGSALRLRDFPGIHTIVADLTLDRTIVVAAENYPDLRIADAVRASMSLPIFVKPYISPEGHIWVDGGVRANFPWLKVPADLRGDVIGLRFNSGERKSPRNFGEFVHSMVHFDEPKKDFGDSHSENILEIPTPPFPAWFLRLRDEDYKLINTLAHTSYAGWLAARPVVVPKHAAGSTVPVGDVARSAIVPKHAAGSMVPVGDVVRSVVVPKHAAGSACPPESCETQPPSDHPYIHPPSCPPHRTAESSGIRSVFPEPFQDSSRPQSPPPTRPSRRWSF